MLSKWKCGMFWVVSQIWGFSSFCDFLILIEKGTKQQQQQSLNEQKETNKENHQKTTPDLLL